MRQRRTRKKVKRMSVNNLVSLIGRPTKEMDFRQNGENSVARFSLAVDRKFSKEKQADFISCVAFNKTAEILNQYVKKGQRIAVMGEIRTDPYEEDGKKVYTTDVVVSEFEFASSKSEEGQPTAPDDFINVEDVDSVGLPFK
jgi:single-strand DNA-binding protein